MIYVSHLLEDEEIKQIISEFHMGVESIEFSISDNLDHLHSRLSLYKKRIEDMNVKNLALHGPFLDLNPAAFDREIRRITRYRFEQAYEAACSLNAEKIIFHTGYIPRVYYPDMWPERVAEFFNEFMEGKQGIPVLLENVYDPLPELWVKVKELTDSEEFGLCLDVGHVHCYSKESVLRWIETGGKYIRHLHIHNNFREGDSHGGRNSGNLPINELKLWIKKYIPQTTATIECSQIKDVRGWYKEISTWQI